VLGVLAASRAILAHSGPPFPIVTGAVRGAYAISIWTDPDATDDGTPGGQFWVVIEPAARGGSIAADTRATLSVRPLDRTVAREGLTASASPVRGDVTNQFASVVMAHEGPYAVRVDVSGSLGQATVDAQVDATYDLRPPPYMLAWYLAPFLLAGTLWARLLLRRRGVKRGSV